MKNVPKPVKGDERLVDVGVQTDIDKDRMHILVQEEPWVISAIAF